MTAPAAAPAPTDGRIVLEMSPAVPVAILCWAADLDTAKAVATRLIAARPRRLGITPPKRVAYAVEPAVIAAFEAGDQPPLALVDNRVVIRPGRQPGTIGRSPYRVVGDPEALSVTARRKLRARPAPVAVDDDAAPRDDGRSPGIAAGDHLTQAEILSWFPPSASASDEIWVGPGTVKPVSDQWVPPDDLACWRTARMEDTLDSQDLAWKLWDRRTSRSEMLADIQRFAEVARDMGLRVQWDDARQQGFTCSSGGAGGDDVRIRLDHYQTDITVRPQTAAGSRRRSGEEIRRELMSALHNTPLAAVEAIDVRMFAGRHRIPPPQEFLDGLSGWELDRARAAFPVASDGERVVILNAWPGYTGPDAQPWVYDGTDMAAARTAFREALARIAEDLDRTAARALAPHLGPPAQGEMLFADEMGSPPPQSRPRTRARSLSA